MIRTEQELDELLSRPSEADRQSLAALEGDLLVLGAGGKMGPTLALRARRAAPDKRVIAVSRFSSPGLQTQLEKAGVETIAADLLDRAQLAALPDVDNVVYLVGRKFGSTGAEYLTWVMNTWVPAAVCERFRHSRIVALSSGNVYPLMQAEEGGATEETPPAPVGEYAQSVLGRERIFEYFSRQWGTAVVLIRLNYAVELRYGVLLDIGQAVFERRPVSLAAPLVNVIWQGDANSVCLRAFRLCSSPPTVLNVTGPETLSVRQIALRFAGYFGTEASFGEQGRTALLSNAALCHRLFGYPSVSVDQMMEWTAQWIGMGGPTYNKPTHFQVTDGRF